MEDTLLPTHCSTCTCTHTQTIVTFIQIIIQLLAITVVDDNQ